MSRHRMSAKARFDARVDRSGDGCWPWLGSFDRKGYGWFWMDGRNRRAAVVALEFALGRPITPGMWALHGCDNPPCVRVGPGHLGEGTPRQNSREMVERGRSTKGTFAGEAHPGSYMTEEHVRTVRRLRGEGLTYRAIAMSVGTTEANARLIARGERWGHVR